MTMLEEIAYRLHNVAQMEGIKDTPLSDVLETDAHYLDALTHDVMDQVAKKLRRGKVAV